MSKRLPSTAHAFHVSDVCMTDAKCAPVLLEVGQRGVDVGREQRAVERLQHEALVDRVGLVDAPEENVGVVADLQVIKYPSEIAMLSTVLARTESPFAAYVTKPA